MLKKYSKPETATSKDDFSDDFFKDFKISLKNQTYFFKPWNEEQKKLLSHRITSLKESILKYSTDRTDQKIKKNLRFPYDIFRDNVIAIIKIFFNTSNLSINFNKNTRLNELIQREPINSYDQEVKKNAFMEHIKDIKPDAASKDFLKNYESFANVLSRPRSKEKLEELVELEEKEIRQEICAKIAKFVFDKFFPNMKENIKNNKKGIIIKQIQKFIIAIDNSFNQII